MKCDYRICGGRVIDPAAGVDEIRDIWIKNGFVISAGSDTQAREEINAEGCLVLPGLIDFHTHLAYQLSDFGLNPDLYTLPNGITSAVDAGSGGTANFEGMINNIYVRSMIDIRCFLNVAATGIITERYLENLNPAFFDFEKIAYLIQKYGDKILGFKVRAGKNTSGPLQLEPLKKTVKLAREYGKRVCLHATNLENSYDEIIDCMGAGDVICHIFQGDTEHTILDENGKVRKSIWEGRKKGIVYDCACGRVNYSNRIMKAALEEGFLPDVISTDIIGFSIYGPKIHSLLSVMSHYLAMGVDLQAIVRATTQVPAHLMGMDGVIGTLQAGAQADLFIARLKKSHLPVTDKFGDTVYLDRVFTPLLTMKYGKLVYRNISYNAFA